MKLKRSRIIVISLVLLSALVYNFFAVGESFWRIFYFTSRDLSISALIFLMVNDFKFIMSKGVAIFTSLLFLVSALAGDILVFTYFTTLIIILILILYGLIFRTIFIKPLINDYYNEKYNYIVVRKPKRIIETLRAYFFLDSIGSVKVVNKGIEYGFKVKKQGTVAVEKKHTYNPNYFVYLRTDKTIIMINNKYNILTNNCINCWSINDILKEIKHGNN